MNNKLIYSFLMRLMRKKDGKIFWVVRDRQDIRAVVDMLSSMINEYKYSPAERILRFANITIIFMTNDDNPDRLQGAIINEVFIDESS